MLLLGAGNWQNVERQVKVEREVECGEQIGLCCGSLKRKLVPCSGRAGTVIPRSSLFAIIYIAKQARVKWREFGDKEIESQEIMRVQTGVVQMERRDLGKINMGRTSSRDGWGKEQRKWF